MEFACPDIAASAHPGQFVMLGLGLETPASWLVPRPFSISWTSPGGVVGILLRTYGEGTLALSRLEVGREALLVGPLGRSFETESRTIECVAGGVGLAPFIFLASREASRGRRLQLLYGERDAEAVFDPALIRRLTGHEPKLFTEDGGAGTRGRVTAGLDPESSALVLACGPTPMLQAVAAFARRHGRDLQLSVEEHMGCGTGACQGCVVRGADGRWLKACVEGSVFDARELDLGG